MNFPPIVLLLLLALQAQPSPAATTKPQPVPAKAPAHAAPEPAKTNPTQGAQPAQTQATQARGDAAQTPSETPDPFRTDEALRGIVDDPSRHTGDFTPLDNAPTMPVMRVRGIVKMKDKPKPAAILEIEGIGRYTVRETERVSFSLPGRFVTAPVARPSGDGGRRPSDGTTNPNGSSQGASNLTVRQQIPIVLRIEKIASDGVVVEVGTLGERLIIR